MTRKAKAEGAYLRSLKKQLARARREAAERERAVAMEWIFKNATLVVLR